MYSYQGIIPHLSLMRLLSKRGERYWHEAITRGGTILVLSCDGQIAGYVTLGPSRLRGTPYGGEIYELYVAPGYHGAGFGRRLFAAARRSLEEAGLRGLLVWALADNDAACAFYRHLGGRPISEGVETYEEKALRKIAFAWPPNR